MKRSWVWALLAACNGDKEGEDDIVPLDTDADTDADADSDTDADTDTDTEPVGRCAPLPDQAGTTVSGGSLADAVEAAASGDVLLLEDGEYAVPGTITVDKPLTIRSASGDRAAVVLRGNGRGGDLFDITSGGVTVASLTVADAGADAFQLTGGAAGLEDVRIHDVVVTDPGGFVVAALGDFAAGTGPDRVEVSCVDATLTAAGRARIPAACEIGGIDAAGVRGWVVRDSAFRGFWCVGGETLAGARFWRGSRDIEVTRNVFGDVATGIVLGEGQDQIGRVYPDEPCGISDVLQTVDATATNNVVSAFDDDLVGGAGVKVGILVESSCNATVLHNSVFAGEAPALASIRQTYATTSGIVANNLLSHDLVRLENATADVAGNVENAPFDAWYFPAQGDFHTAPGAVIAIDQGDPAHTVPDDLDGEARTDGLPDVGADEQTPR